MNNRGDFIGVSSAKGFVWDRGRMTDLDNHIPLAIDDGGRVVVSPPPFLWQHGKTRLARASR